MANEHWAIFALKDIQNAIDGDRYDVAMFHIEDAIAAIMARDEQDGPVPTHLIGQDRSATNAN